MLISSKTNKKVKMLISLASKKGRKETGLFLIEGFHMVKEAINFKYCLSEIFVAESQKDLILPKIKGAMCDITILSDAIFDLVSNTVSSQGVLAVAYIPKTKPFFAGKPFLVLDRIQDPGNLGTIIRTAVATGFENIILVDCVDPFNPKVVRSSSSGIFFVNLYFMSNDEVVNIAQSHFFYVATAEGDSVFDIKNLPVSFGLVLGNEANGVSTEFKNIGKKISLPMSGAIESLNVSVAAGVFMYYFSHFGL